MHAQVVNLNGKVYGPDQIKEAKISVFDRGFIYGDSIYEVVRTYDGVPFVLNAHLERLDHSAQLCRMTLSQPIEVYRQEMIRTIEHFLSTSNEKTRDVYCRLIVTRGAGKIGFGLSAIETPTQYCIIVKPAPLFTQSDFSKGLKMSISKRLRNDRRALDPAMKSGNYLNNLLAFLEAESQGFDDTLLCNVDGHVTEGTTFNIFYVRRGIVATPPLDVGILDGITRRLAIKATRKIGIPLRETYFPKERLYGADEIFMTSTLREVFPVTRLDQKAINDGRPGEITSKIHDAFQKERDSILRAEGKH